MRTRGAPLWLQLAAILVVTVIVPPLLLLLLLGVSVAVAAFPVVICVFGQLLLQLLALLFAALICRPLSLQDIQKKLVASMRGFSTFHS